MTDEIECPELDRGSCAFCLMWRSVVDVDLIHVCYDDEGEVDLVVSFCSSKCQSGFMLMTSGESLRERYNDWWGV